MKALRRRLPSSLRTGMLWRLGRSDDRRPGARHGLAEGGVDAPVRGHLGQQGLAVGGAQLLHLAVAEQGVDDGVLAPQLLEGRGVGGESGLGLAARGEPEAVVEHGPQLRRRVDVEGLARELVDEGLEAGALGDEPVGDAAQLRGVDAHPGHLHAGQHAHQGALHLVVEPLEPGTHQGLAHGDERAAPSATALRAASVDTSTSAGPSRASWPAASASTSASSARPSCTSTTSSRR